MSTILILGMFVVFIGLFAGLYLRRRGMKFEGVVTDKDVREVQVNNTNRPQQSGISIGMMNNGGL